MELNNILNNIKESDAYAMKKAEEHWLDVAKPLFGLGKLEGIITKIAGIKKSPKYSISKKAVIVMCADNGVVEEGVTQTGQEMTAVVSENFLRGMTSVCIMAKTVGAEVFPVDIGIKTDVEGLSDSKFKVAYGTKNITKGSAMSENEVKKAIFTGVEKVRILKEKGFDILGTGEMGIGNTTTSSAVISVLLDMEAEKVTGKGAGLSNEGLAKKINAVKRAIEVNKPDKNNPLDVLMKVGGLDIAGLTGVFLGGAYYRVPIVIDGFISSTAALLAVRLNENVKDYIIASHISKEGAGKFILDELGLSPIINADMCVGEGTGAVALFPLLDMVHNVYDKMLTFSGGNYTDTYKIL